MPPDKPIALEDPFNQVQVDPAVPETRPTCGDAYLDLLKQCLAASIYEESAWQIWGSRKKHRNMSWKARLRWPLRFARRLLIDWLQQVARKRSLMIVERKPFDPDVRQRGKDWPLFGYTMIGMQRLDNIQTCLEDILRNDVPGDLIETGAWRGGATMLMRAVLKRYGVTDRTVWVADSFEGLPKPNVAKYGADAGGDLSHHEVLKVSLEQVQANFARFGLLDDQVRFLKGWFCDTLPGAPIEKLALLRLDGDLYESTIDALDALYHRVSPGGYVIVDDYHTWHACRKAVIDFRNQHGIEAPILDIDGSAVYWQVPLTTERTL